MDSTLVYIHPTVLFTIIDSFERRKEDAKRVIGTLLGNVHGNIVTVTNCFCVPHNESKDEVAVDMEFARTMTDFHAKANPSESIVGWYATGIETTTHSRLIHEYYCREAKNPIHLIMDTDVQSGDMGIKCYIAASIGVPDDSKKGILFQPIKTEIKYYNSERVAIDTITKATENLLLSKNGSLKEAVTTLPNDFDIMLESVNSLLDMVKFISDYVESVLKGDIPMNPKVGRKLMDLMKLVPYMEETEFSAMLTNNLNDTLMVRFLADAVKSQVALNEKVVNTSSILQM